MRLLLVGPPGAGKGTQAQFLAAHYSIPHISTGDIFRANLKAGTDLGNQAKAFMDRGELVPDSVTNDMVKDRLTHDDVANGFLLDGYPRNVAQADVLRAFLAENKTPLQAALELSIAPEEIIKRLSSRRTCRACGASSAAGATNCSSCNGADLYQREDDKEEVIARRLEVYKEQTSPIIAFYQNEGILLTIPALGTVAQITDQAITALSKLA
ncbi:adenylate kinase [Actinobacteria bacterium IMCC26103]|nr:adenylate kinase [Actinobacteria bacterium IMCC26103]